MKQKSAMITDKETISMLHDIQAIIEGQMGPTTLVSVIRYCVKSQHRIQFPAKYKEQEENALLH